MKRDWEARYATGETPWDTGEPAPELVELCEAGRLPRGRALEIGCGSGNNVRYLARRGYQVVGVDLSRHAIERARASTEPRDGSIELRQLDFLADEPLAGPFDLAFDRGCFHVFDDPADRARFAERVAGCLAPEGLWLSLAGSTEGPPREEGPPRRSARDIVNAVEPVLEVVELQGVEMDGKRPARVRGWVLIARLRAVPAQPSTV
jgi:SAM-dependent methyltransferase